MITPGRTAFPRPQRRMGSQQVSKSLSRLSRIVNRPGLKDKVKALKREVGIAFQQGRVLQKMVMLNGALNLPYGAEYAVTQVETGGLDLAAIADAARVLDSQPVPTEGRTIEPLA